MELSVDEVRLEELAELPPLRETFAVGVEPFVLLLSKRKLVFTFIPSLRKSIYNPGREIAFHRAMPLEDGTVFITGASGGNHENMRHSCMLYDGKEVLYRLESDLGISSVTLAALKKTVYLVGGKGCEKNDLDVKKVTKIEAPVHSHISGGICTYNGSILLVGGIHCQSVELYHPAEQHWSQVINLQDALYNIVCIQVKQTEVLIFGGGVFTTWLLNVETGTIKTAGDLPVSLRDTNVIENVPVLHDGVVYCYIGREQDIALVKYTVATDTWERGPREVTGCCAIL